ncbi:sensor histidine kinase [Leeia oryzae]|uniref:sensor histidine kinase n=1 Tax=Leeia oryzae TaxID=356662 RepID=UPI00036D2F5E|nr:ATP-binding protein [Leeia oryzae]
MIEDSQQALTPQQLQAAFLQFNEASLQLSAQFDSLQQQVAHLSSELAASNAALQAQLQEKEALAQRVSSLLAVLPAGVLELDATDVITATNWAAEHLLGADLPGQQWQHVADRMLKDTSVPQEYELVGHSQLHGLRLSLQTTALPDGRGRLILLTDLSEHYRLQQQLAQHRKLAAMGEMAAGLAHQLRTPLATAILYVGHLNKPQLQDQQRLKFADKARSRLLYLEGLIADMLLFVRGDNSEKETFLIGDWLFEAVHTIQPVAEEKQVDIKLAMQLDHQTLFGDRKSLLGALVNVLENALAFSPAGSHIGIEAHLQGQRLLVTVLDAGPGIADEILEKVFTPFFTTRQEGTGLGLAIVKSVLEAHGGDITLQNQPAGGCEACIELPLKS